MAKSAHRDPSSQSRHDREERAAVFWGQQINDGRALRQARFEMQQGERETASQTPTATPRQPRARRPQ